MQHSARQKREPAKEVPQEDTARENPIDKNINAGVTRRQALSTAGKVVVGAAAAAVVAGGLGYYAATLSGPRPEITSTATIADKAQRLATAKPGERFLIGNITIALALEVSTIFDQSAAQAARALGVDYKTRDIGFSVTEPIAAARELIAQGAKGILSFALDPGAMYQVARLCQENKVFFSSWWSIQPFTPPWAIGDYFLKFGFQDCETDELAVSTLLFQKLKGQGKVINIQGTANLPSNAIKNFGIVQAWKKYPDIRLVGHPYGLWDLAEAKKVTEETLASTPDINGVVTVNDSMSAGAVLGGQDKGLKLGPFATGVDGQRVAVEMARDGNFLATSSFNSPYIYGMGLCELYDAITGAYYPPDKERLNSTSDTLIVADVDEVKRLAAEANFKLPYPVISGREYYDKVYEPSTFPWDWRRMSRGKAKELGLEYDPTGGTGLGGQHSYVDALGSEANFSQYVLDCVNRFANLAADTFADLSKPPYAPTAATPNLSTYDWYLRQP